MKRLLKRLLNCPGWVLRWIVRHVFLIHPTPPPDPRFEQLKALMENGHELTDNEEHLAGLAVENYRYNRIVERRLRRFTVESRVLYGVAVLLAMGTAALFVQVQDQRRARTADQSATNVQACESTELATERLIDLQGRARTNAVILKSLIENLLDPPPPTIDERQRDTRRDLRMARDQLAENISEISDGIVVLKEELVRVDCASLRANRPFRE